MELLEQLLEKCTSELCEYGTLEDSLHKLVQSVNSTFDYQSMGIFMKDTVSNQMKFKTGYRLSPYFVQSIDGNIPDELLDDIQNGKIIQCGDSKKFKFEYDYSDLLVAPLNYPDEIEGFMFIDKVKNQFTQDEISVFHVYANICNLLFRIFSRENALELSARIIDPFTNLHVETTFMKHGIRMFEQMHRYYHELHYVAFRIVDFRELLHKIGKQKEIEFRQKIGKTLISQLRKYDLIGSTGSDICAIMLPETPTELVIAVVKRLNELISAFPELKNHRVCWGIASISKSTMTLDELQHKAESVLDKGIPTSKECIFIDKNNY